ncbi:MAG: hypothetical protein K6F74_05445 [Prevotella sp.]|nr:hypothetical protein [Prevotella sp.]
MYLSYYQHPELQLLDEERCEDYVNSKNCELWLLMSNDVRERLMAANGIDGCQRDEFVARQRRLVSNGFLAEKIKNIYMPSKSFDETMLKSSKAFGDMPGTTSVFLEVQENCCFLLDHGKTKLFLFRDADNEEGLPQFILFSVQMQGIMNFYAEFCINPKEQGLGICFVWRPQIEGYIGAASGDPMWNQSDSEVLWLFFRMMNMYLIFKKYSDVEMEVVCREKTLKKSGILKEKVNNFMGINVTLLDSNWFTTICRNEGFAVRGHFRLQPCKQDGEWTRKLIYINPYTKNGYHRQARMENRKLREEYNNNKKV